MPEICNDWAPDRSGRTCDKPKGHLGPHWTYGGRGFTWPSKQLPGRMFTAPESTIEDAAFVDGWNACLDEFLAALDAMPREGPLTDAELLARWRAVCGVGAQLNGPLIRYGNLCAAAMGRRGGLAGKGKTSPAKAAAARANGAKGGRPPKSALPQSPKTESTT